MPFQFGQSGNPSGRPSGARNKRTIALENIMEGELEVITRKVIEMAKGGHMAAIRLVVDRLAPASKDRSIDFALPALNTPADAIAHGGDRGRRFGGRSDPVGERPDCRAWCKPMCRRSRLFDIEKRLTKIEARPRQEHANQTG